MSLQKSGSDAAAIAIEVCLVIFSAILCYAIGGFISMRWDVAEWSAGERFSLVYGWIAVSAIAIFFRRFPK